MAEDKSRTPVKPFLIENDERGGVRLTVRTTRFNRWNYPVVDCVRVEQIFSTVGEARAHARDHFGAEAGQFASK